ncbi:hypothetical protein [Sulfurimonas sp.]|uniref:hypothetical protein n=1 Tax=Sulfurimonas sp. TaxID=2022749 RepID=UPI002622BC29|nr:hypothetical protein [Sulfurimonas sp.]
MKFLEVSEKTIRSSVAACTKVEIDEFVKVFKTLFREDEELAKRYLKLRKKEEYIDFLTHIFITPNLRAKLYAFLAKDKHIVDIYKLLVWEHKVLDREMFVLTTGCQIENHTPNYYFRHKVESLGGKLSLICHSIYQTYDTFEDIIYIEHKIRSLLKFIIPLPDDYDILDANPSTDAIMYNNEAGVLDFIKTIFPMLQNNLVDFGKTEIKPLTKTLTLLKNSTISEEFYSAKECNTLATDMLTRSFYNFYKKNKHFKTEPYEALLDFYDALIQNRLDFMISRILLAHLKKVRYDSYYQSERQLFMALSIVMDAMRDKEFVSVENILNFFKYRDIEVHIDSLHKEREYIINCDISEQESNTLSVREYHYTELMFEPMIKGGLFYYAALGVVEIIYKEPKSPYKITVKGKKYLTCFDSIEYVKLTSLGRYIFGIEKKYDYIPQQIKKQKDIIFDTFKPIITVDKSDVVTSAKLDSFCDKLTNEKYQLSYSKLFKDVKSKKGLELKIESFYKTIEPNPPQVFKDFFDEVLQNANQLKKETKLVVLSLQNNPKLLNLFMQNKKIQQLITKAQGYKIVIEKENVVKLTKLIKDNGFFVEF